MIGRLKDLNFDRDGKQVLTLTLKDDFRRQYDELKGADLEITIKKHRERRSLSANAYFHVLVNAIAAKQKLGDEEVKRHLVMEYGALMRDADGQTVGVKVPAKTNITAMLPYARRFDTRIEDGKEFTCYLVYKPTHLMDSVEMSRLIDGTIYEARELGIETDTPDELARRKALWGME